MAHAAHKGHDDVVKANLTLEFSVPVGVLLAGAEKVFSGRWPEVLQIGKVVLEGAIIALVLAAV